MSVPNLRTGIDGINYTALQGKEPERLTLRETIKELPAESYGRPGSLQFSTSSIPSGAAFFQEEQSSSFDRRQTGNRRSGDEISLGSQMLPLSKLKEEYLYICHLQCCWDDDDFNT